MLFRKPIEQIDAGLQGIIAEQVAGRDKAEIGRVLVAAGAESRASCKICRRQRIPLALFNVKARKCLLQVRLLNGNIVFECIVYTLPQVPFLLAMLKEADPK